MASSEYQIYIDFITANRQCAKLESLASELEQKGSRRLQEVLDGVRRNWSGENADAFLQKVSVLPGRISGTAENLRHIASTMRTIAKNIYDSEMEAVRIARERTLSN